MLVLVGPPASGKTTVGTAVADALGVVFRDTDRDVEAQTGSSVTDLFVTQGEPHFRALERRRSPARWPSTTACSRWAGER